MILAIALAALIGFLVGIVLMGALAAAGREDEYLQGRMDEQDELRRKFPYG